MSKIALWDSETNGFLKVTDKMHCVGAEIDGVWWLGIPSEYDPRVLPEERCPYEIGSVVDLQMPTAEDGTPGDIIPDVHITTVEEVLRLIGEAEVSVAHNGNDFDDRVKAKLHPDLPWTCKGLDTLLLSRLLYPDIFKKGPNTHKVPGAMKIRHSIEAWGYRLGERKAKSFDATGGGRWDAWQVFTWPMATYMVQDIRVLKRLFRFLMAQKPSPESSALEHDFATIIRRQEAWGFTFDHEKALQLQADLQQTYQRLELSLVEKFGEWWAPGKVTHPKATRLVKVPLWPNGTKVANVTMKRVSPTTGKELKPYVGPPLCEFMEGVPYTPITWTTFQPGSRDHVKLKLQQLYGWKPTKFSKKTGAPAIDDDVLRALPWPEAQQLADFYQVMKILGYVSQGKKAWITTAVQEGDEWRQHGRVMTVGTYTFRCSHSDPNLGQVPTRSPEFGHRCRELFTARKGFTLMGFDGSGMQLRLMAHHMARFDGGEYARVFEEGLDPHGYMRDTVGTDLMGEGDEGRGKGKTLNYALLFGGGDLKLGTIVAPLETERNRKAIGAMVRERLNDRFGAFSELTVALRKLVEENGYIIGLDRRRAPCPKPHAALATLLQMGEAIVMRKSLVILDQALQSEGLRPGVGLDGFLRPLNEVDYEFAANVHDEAQADVRPYAVDTYERLALACVRDAGLQLGVKCPLKSDVKKGPSWLQTH